MSALTLHTGSLAARHLLAETASAWGLPKTSSSALARRAQRGYVSRRRQRQQLGAAHPVLPVLRTSAHTPGNWVLAFAW